MAFVLVPIRDGKRLMNDAIRIDGTEEEIFIKDLLQLTVSCCHDDEGPEYRNALVNNFTNIPRDMKFLHSKNDEWSLDVSGLRDQTKINDNQTVASFYQDGGKAENKVAPYAPIKLVEGSVIEFRPPPQHRSEKFSRNLKFMVVAADADADVGEEEEETGVVVVVPVVDADAGADIEADDGVQEAEEAEEEQLEVVPAASRLDEPLVRFP